jgi:hypothetical protein
MFKNSDLAFWGKKRFPSYIYTISNGVGGGGGEGGELVDHLANFIERDG